MLLKTFHKKASILLKAEGDYRCIADHMKKHGNGPYVTGIKKLGKKLGVSSKNTVKKLIKLFKEGKEAFVDFYLKKKSSSRSYPLELKQMIGLRFNKYLEKFERFKKKTICFKTFIEEEAQEYTLKGLTYYPSSSYIHSALLDLGICSSLSRHITKRKAIHRKKHIDELPTKTKAEYKKILEDVILTDLKEEQTVITDKTPLTQQKTYQVGQRIEQDGWEFTMENGKKVNLTLTIECSSGRLLGGHVSPTETNKGHLMSVVMAMLTYGKSLIAVFDKRAGIYGGNKAQIRDMLKDIGVEVITSSNANSKPKVERTNRTFENDVIYVWMLNNNIKTIEEFNQNIQSFIDFYNTKYNKVFAEEESLFVPLSNSDLTKLKISYDVNIMEDQTMYFQGKRYGFLDRSGQRCYINPGIKKMTINYAGEMTISSLRRNYICSENYAGKKVYIPSIKALKQLTDNFKKLGTNVSREELADIHEILDSKINRLISLQNNDTI